MSILPPTRLGIPPSCSSNLSKQGTETNPSLEKREQYQEYSQDTKHRFQASHEEKFARKKSSRALLEMSFKFIVAPHHSLFFLQPQNHATSPFDSSPSGNITPHSHTRPNPGPRSNLHTRQQRHVNPRPNIITKNRSKLSTTSIHPSTLHHRHNRCIIKPEIGSNRPRTQRASSTNDTIPNIRQMRHLRPLHQNTILHITISPNLRPFPHHSVRSKIRVRTHNRVLSNEYWTFQVTSRTDRTSPRQMKHPM